MKKIILMVFVLLFLSACSRVTTPYYTVNIPFVDLNIDAMLKKDEGMIHASQTEKTAGQLYPGFKKYLLLRYCLLK